MTQKRLTEIGEITLPEYFAEIILNIANFKIF